MHMLLLWLKSPAHVQLQQVAKATLALFVDEIFTVAEVAVGVLWLLYGFSLRNGNILSLQSDDNVLRWI